MKDVSVGTVTVKDSYSLLYNAPGGIYEVFWRQFDLLLRHSLNNVSAQFLLPSTLKSTLRVHSPVLFEGVKCFPNKVGFTLGGGNRPAECTLLTTNLQRPACLPPIIDMDRPEYYWEQIGTSSPVDEEHWKAAGFTPQTTVKCPSIFLRHQRPHKWCKEVHGTSVKFGTVTTVRGVWTEPAANGFTGMRSLP